MAIGEGLVGLVGGLINTADPSQGSKKYAKQLLELWRGLPEPEYSDEVIPWQQLLLQGELSPETYEPFVAGDVSTVQEDPALRESQLRALLGMEQVAREGLPLQDRLRAEEAQRAVSGEFGRANEGIIRNLAARGRAGGGTELAARLAASGDAAEMARGLGSDLARESISNRLMALREAPQMAGNIRGMDRETAALNSQMENRYNEWLSNLKTTAAMNAARSREAANIYNLGNRQRLHEANVLGGYQSRLGERQRQDDIQNQLFDARRISIAGQGGALDWVGMAQNAREQAKEDRIKGISAGTGSIVDSLLGAYGGKTGALLAK